MPESVRKKPYMNTTLLKRAGLSLVEILMALFILAIAILPALGTFSSYYGVATRQMDQEIALKLGEAVVNVLMTTTYSELILGTTPSLPLNIQTPSGSYEGTLNFTGGYATGTPVTIGKTSYVIGAEIKKIFSAQNIQAPHNRALEFTWQAPGAPLASSVPPAPGVSVYSCFDDLICIKVSVDYGGAKPVQLATFRADMTR